MGEQRQYYAPSTGLLPQLQHRKTQLCLSVIHNDGLDCTRNRIEEVSRVVSVLSKLRGASE